MSIHKKNIATLKILILVLMSYQIFADSSVNETIVEDTPVESSDTGFTYYKDKSADQAPGDASMLYHIPGLTLTETSGHMGTTGITYRGLSNSRLDVEFEGLRLNNPSTGHSDANGMFLFAASKLQTDASSLLISLPKFDSPKAKGVLGFGSQSSIKAGASIGAPIDKYSSIFLATQATSTKGDFSFSSQKNQSSNKLTRKNNDHHRLQALANYQRRTSTGGAHALAAVNVHQGGIPGYAASPTNSLRSEEIFSGVSLGISKKINSTEISLDSGNSLFNYSTADKPKNDENFVSSTHDIKLGFKPLKQPAWLDMSFAQTLVVERAYSIDKTRIGGGLVLKRKSTFKGKLKPKMFSNFKMMGYHHHGLIFKKDLGLTIEPTDFISITGSFARTQRLPTFMEMYANNNFFRGNEDLKKESIWDIGLGATFRLGQTTRLQVNGFLGYLSDAIVYEPFLATKLRPINTDSAKRHGIDLNLNFEPLTWLGLESRNSYLYTKIKSTNASLPNAPSFLGLSKIRFGNIDSIALSLQSRYRSTTSANIYGTLRSRGYALFDSIIWLKPTENIGLSLSVTNIFNNKLARDTYEMPLPPTTFFAQIELGGA